MIIEGTSPFRISFYGGGTDIEPYPSEYGSLCISHSINLGCYASLDLSSDKKVIEDLNNLKKYIFKKNYNKNKLFEIFQHFIKEKKYNFKYFFDLPTGSGLGSSGAFVALIASILMQAKELKDYNKKDTANLAYKLEKDFLKTSGGRQDEFASIFGGFNSIEFKKDTSRVIKLSPSEKFMYELEKRSILIFTGVNRKGSPIIDKHIELYKDKKNVKFLHKNKKLATTALKYVKRNDYQNFIDKINYYWELKKTYNPLVTNSRIDKLIKVAKKSGSHSAKLLGAGNGGHLLIFSPVEKRSGIIKKLIKLGCTQRHFTYTQDFCKIFIK